MTRSIAFDATANQKKTRRLLSLLAIAIIGVWLSRNAFAHAKPAQSIRESSSQSLVAPTYSRDVAAILFENCTECHRPGGSAPFPLLTYEDAKRHAAKIAEVTKRRYMPPWLPEHGFGDFAGERRLTEAQIQLIDEWVNHGAPEGDAAKAPPPPHYTSGWQLGQPDMILEASRSITLPPTGPDVFWNFIFSPQVATKRYVRAIEIRPGGPHLVHHANVIVDREGSARRQEQEPGAGFPGMDLKIMRTTFDFDSHFLFWKPGSAPWVEPDGFSWELDPGNDLVLNAHMRPMGKPMQVKPSVGLYFTDKPPEHFPMLMQLEDDQALDIPPGDRDFVIQDHFRLPMDVQILAVYPHAHYLGHLLEGFAMLPNGQRQWLIRIPNWDPNWQGVYHYATPAYLPKGTVIWMRYHYDNSSANPRNPHHPPQRVLGGNMSTDEMGHLWLQVLPVGPGDRRRELEQALMEHRLAKDPRDVQARVMLGALMLSRLNPSGAVAILREAVRIDPKQSRAHNLLGAALNSLGLLPEAEMEFHTALQLDPHYVNARYNLAKALARTGRLDEAEAEYRETLAEVPNDPQVHNDLGEVLAREGKRPEALKEFDAALAIDPKLGTAQRNRDMLSRH